VERLSELLGPHVQFRCTAWDRIVLNGYLQRLQRPENLVHFFREVVGVPCVTPEVLLSRTPPYRATQARYAAEQAIPVVAAPPGGRKEEVVVLYYRRYAAAEGVDCLLTSVEAGRTFVSYTPRYPPPGQDPHYRLIHACRKRFLHYYLYLLDPVLGPMRLRVGTFLPFTLACLRNGHSFLAQEAHPAGGGVPQGRQRLPGGRRPGGPGSGRRALDAAPARGALRPLGPPAGPGLQRRRAGRPAAGLPLQHRPDRARHRCGLQALGAAPGALPAGHGAGHTGGRRRPHDAPVRAAHHPALRGQAAGGARPAQRGPADPAVVLPELLRQAVREGRPAAAHRDLYQQHPRPGHRPPPGAPPGVRERMLATNTRYLDTQAEALASTVGAGALAALARPVVVGRRCVPGLRLEDDRGLRLMAGLVHPGTFVADWTTREVRARLLTRNRLAEAATGWATCATIRASCGPPA